MEVLILTPCDDRASRRSAAWAKVLAEMFPSTTVRHAPRTRESTEELLSRYQHVLYFGHGEIDSLVSRRRFFRPRQVLIDDSNLGAGQERLVVAVACWSGDGLARTVTRPEAVLPVRSYVGWRDEVSWPEEWPDPIGAAIIDGLRVLFDGGTVEECADTFTAAFKGAYRRYREEGGQRMTPERVRLAKMCAINWWVQLAVEGDRSATL